MTKHVNVLTAFLLAVGALASAASGCELIASVDRSKIPSSTGGSGAGGSGIGGTTTTTTTTPSTGGSGTGGQGNMCDGGAACMAAGDCTPQTTKCITNSCVGGCCGTALAAARAACTDSNGTLCDGNGKCVACLMTSDCTASTTKCKTTTCDGTAHTCGSTNAAKGTACTDNGGTVCDGNGTCTAAHCTDGVKDGDETDVDCGGSCGATCKDTNPQQACLVPADCINGVCTNMLCQPPTCTDGVQNGTETGTDCGGAACDGLGLTCAPGTGCATATDCTGTAGCNGTTFTSAPTCSGTPKVCVAGAMTDCSTMSSAMTCDPVLGCVGCDTLNDCPPTGNECVVNTCTGHVCGTSNLGNAHVLMTGQTPGDCQSLVCDGNGGITSVNDLTDVPAASGSACLINPHCDTSSNPATPAYDKATTGTSCTLASDPAAHVCGDTTNGNIAGTCVECNSDTDCAALEAGTPTCNTAMGTCQ